MPISKIFGKKCVRCDKTRTKKEFEGLPTCEKCELQIAADREEKHPCPMCQADMEKKVVLNVIVDRCPSGHGAWLDGGELELLQKAISSGASSNLATGMVLGMAIG
jgi:hypothetical protein